MKIKWVLFLFEWRSRDCFKGSVGATYSCCRGAPSGKRSRDRFKGTGGAQSLPSAAYVVAP